MEYTESLLASNYYSERVINWVTVLQWKRALGAVHMIPEWVSFRNEFRSRMKFVLHSHMTKSTGSAILKRTVLSGTLKMIHNCHVPLAPDYMACSFTSPWSSLSVTWYQNEMSYQNEKFIRIENRNELILEWPVRERNFVPVSCKQIQKNIWGWNEFVLEWAMLRATLSRAGTANLSTSW